MCRHDGGGFEEVVGGECSFFLKVVVVDRAGVLIVDELVIVFADASRDLVEEGFS